MYDIYVADVTDRHNFARENYSTFKDDEKRGKEMNEQRTRHKAQCDTNLGKSRLF